MLKQEYNKYTQEDFKVWDILFNRQMKNLPGAASDQFLVGMEKIHFTGDAIPDFEKVNVLLKEMTGWQIQAVPGIVADDVFFELLSRKKFPATCWLRKMSQLDYLEEPDMFHDVFAHCPLLTNQAFVNFLQELSLIALENIDNPVAIDLISRIYWFTVEFGLIKESDSVRIYGAGILSSAGETKFCLSGEPELLPFDVSQILDEPYAKDKFQVKYFIIDSYEQLFASIPEIRQKLALKVITAKVIG
jgi:phenylalanine-4-hydroxylase